MQKHLLILLILGTTLQTCKKGCLKCSESKNCLLCDTTTNYKLENDSCSLTEQPNCALINAIGDCLGCKSNYWLDLNSKKCVIVEIEKKIENCLNYNSSQICINCEKDFFIERAKCVAVVEKLENCEVYKSLDSCANCQNGYFVSEDEKSCEIVPNISGCSYFSRFQCDSCKDGFIFNRNLYFKHSFLTSSSAEKEETLANILMNKTGKKSIANRPVCQETIIKNCSIVETFNSCKTCNPGYFIKEDKSCEQFPKSIIKNCSLYSSFTECSNCSEGFHLISPSECKLNSPIENCVQYSQNTPLTQCQKCASEYYLSSLTSCSPRKMSSETKISNCKIKSINSDTCSECNSNFVLSSQQDECRDKIANCEIHNSFLSGNAISCSKCSRGHFSENNFCITGGDSNCEIFANGGNCSKCKNTFFHKDLGACEKHLGNPNCLVFSDSEKNECVSCDNFTFNFFIAKKCKVLKAIDHCLVYNHKANASIALCATCENGYYESSNGISCILIQLANCAKVENDNPALCTECKEGFNLFVYAGTTTECKNPHEYLTEQCNTLTNTGTNRIQAPTCDDCKSGSLTVDYENNFACINDQYLKDESIGIVTEILGCVKYVGTKCVMCQAGKYLQTNQLSCEVNCASGAITQFSPFYTTSNGNDYWINLYNYCGNDSKDKLLAEDVTSSSNLITISCADNLMPVVLTDLTVENSQSYSNISLDGYFGNWIQDIGTVNPELDSCTSLGEGVILEDNTTLLTSNCEYYGVQTGNTYGCLRCKNGFSAKASGDDSKVLETGGCSPMDSCSSDQYGNIPAYWAKFFSCHKCSLNNNIPYLFYKFETTKTNIQFKSYDTFDLKNPTEWSTANTNKTIECLDNVDKENLKIQLGMTNLTITFIENCGLGIFDLSDTRGNFTAVNLAIDGYNSTIFCAVCKPGFKPTIRDVHTVKSCVEIDNCSNSTWFNACSECDENFAFDYTNSGVDYTKCVANTDQYCFAAAAASKCSLCKKGYSINADGFCVIVNTPKCQNNKFVPRITVNTSTHIKDFGYLFWYSEQGPGCNECNSGYSAIKYNSGNYPKLGCALSLYLAINSKNFPKTPTNKISSYINNCATYKVHSTQITCTKCSGNFVLRENGSECINVLNCIKAINGSNTGCEECASGYGLTTGGGCVKGNTANCESYFSNVTNLNAKCRTCSEGFFMNKDNLCMEGAVQNCLVHGDSANRCIECKDGYFLIQNNLLSEGYDYCFKFEKDLNCSAVNITNENNIGARFSCTTCSFGNSVFETPLDTENRTNCLSFNLIENCDTYNVGDDLKNSSFSCSLCKTGFYTTISGFKCVKREVSPVSCKTYQNDADLCSLCNEGYFLSTDKKECIPFPTGVIGCSLYTNLKTCTACGNDYWLDGGACTAILDDEKVENCSLYSNATTCSTCKINFMLEGNTCVTVNVSDCEIYTSKDSCEKCLPNFRLMTENSKNNCESITTPPNCKKSSESLTNPCLVCNQNFYINESGDCAPSSPEIPNCLTNSTINTCQICSPGFALSKDKKKCETSSTFETNCKTAIKPQEMLCSQCNPGFYFEARICVEFKGRSIKQGCFSQVFEDEDKCSVCNTGFYMNSGLECVKIETGFDGGEGGEESGAEGLGIVFKVLGILILF